MIRKQRRRSPSRDTGPDPAGSARALRPRPGRHWCRTRHFDLDRHVLRVALPSPGTADQFDALVVGVPLAYRSCARVRCGNCLIIEGLEDGRAAAALKMHHALADGVSGAETFASLFDITPDVRAPHRPRDVDDEESTYDVAVSLCSRDCAARAISRVTLLDGRGVVVHSGLRRRAHVGARRAARAPKARDARSAVDLRSATHVIERSRRGRKGLSPDARPTGGRQTSGEVSRGVGDRLRDGDHEWRTPTSVR